LAIVRITKCPQNINKSISVNMLVGPPIEPYIKYALSSVEWVDQIVFVYNNAHPENILDIQEWAKQYKGDLRVVDYFASYEDFRFDQARNLAIDNSTCNYIWKVDADEVYYNSFQDSWSNTRTQYDRYSVSFFHMYFDLKHYYKIYTQEVIFRNNKNIRWHGVTHERTSGYKNAGVIDEKFMHLGYIKPQSAISDKWVLYATLEGDPDRYGVLGDRSHFLDDEWKNVIEFNGDHPEAIQELL
jgi:hypothetical protein